jgi:hypothetical protein
LELRKAKVGPQIVRAWFDTVINPLLSWLGREQELLAAKNWTWRFKPAGLEAIRHLSAYVDARPNWEQFEQLYFQNPEFGLYLVKLIVRRYEMNHGEGRRGDSVSAEDL